MPMKVVRLEREAWKKFSKLAHVIAFNEEKDPESDRIDYALLVVETQHDQPAGYVTCRELDSRSVYWQFGGAFPGTKGTIHAFKAYSALMGYARGHYDRVGTLIENTNLPMLKMAMRIGFRAIGIRNFKGSVLLEHLIEFEGAPNG